MAVGSAVAGPVVSSVVYPDVPGCHSDLQREVAYASRVCNHLGSGQEVNIITFNNYVYKWKTQLTLATSENIQSAKTYLLSLQTGYGSNLDVALQNALSQFSDKNQSNSILLFTDGFSPVDPLNIEKLNVNRAGIFCIGMGEDLNRARLEMISPAAMTS